MISSEPASLAGDKVSREKFAMEVFINFGSLSNKHDTYKGLSSALMSVESIFNRQWLKL
jgi:hypothetical protein